MPLPELGLAEHGGENLFRAIERAVEAGQEPVQPRRDVEAGFLRRLEQVLIGLPLQAHLRQHAVEALRTRHAEAGGRVAPRSRRCYVMRFRKIQ